MTKSQEKSKKFQDIFRKCLSYNNVQAKMKSNFKKIT